MASGWLTSAEWKRLRMSELRAALTAAAAASTSVRQIHAYQCRLNAADRPVEEAVKTIRGELGLPPRQAERRRACGGSACGG